MNLKTYPLASPAALRQQPDLDPPERDRPSGEWTARDRADFEAAAMLYTRDEAAEWGGLDR